MAEKRNKRKAINEPGHAHELTFSCYRRFRFLGSERTCSWMREAIDQAREALDFDLWAYVFMPEHVHLIVCPRRREYDISAIMKSIKQPVSRRAVNFLREHSSDCLARVCVPRGNRVLHHFWQPGGGYDRNITSGRMLAAMVDYIHANPVRRGLATRPSDWPWSSAGWFQEPTRQLSPLKPDRIPPELTEPADCQTG